MVKPEEITTRLIFIKSWAYFVASLAFSVAALYLGEAGSMILGCISGFFALAGLLYFFVAAGHYINGQRKHGLHLAFGSLLIFIYCCLIIVSKLYKHSAAT